MSLATFKEAVTNGRNGVNHGLGTGLPKLDDITGGLTKSTFTLLFASSGVGKSSFALYAYIYSTLKEHLNDGKIKIVMFALEMKEDFIIAKLLSTYLSETYNVKLTAKQILSIGRDYTLPDDLYEYVQMGYEWLEQVYKVLIIKDGAHSSDKVIAETMDFLKEEGTFDDNKYIPKNPEQTNLIIIDHAGLLIPSNGRNKKGEIDDCANKLVVIRNKTNLSIIFIMQSNRAVANMERKKNDSFMEPMIEDIKETGTPSEAAELVLAVYNPQVDKRSTYRGYSVKEMGYRFRSIIVLKSRYGENQVADCCFFDGATNTWKELPKPEEIYDYSVYRSNTSDNIKENENVDQCKTKLNFNL